MSTPKAIGRFEPRDASKHQRDWLRVAQEGGNKKLFLPYLTRVDLLDVVVDANGKKRDRFMIQDFEHKGKIALSTHDAASGSRLVDRPTYAGPALVRWNSNNGQVTVASASLIVASGISDPKVPDGKYALRPKLPMDRRSAGHFSCEKYQSTAPHACHWWLIEWEPHRGFSFHCGLRTAGCVTVTDHAKWKQIYEVLSKARTPDNRFSGHIEISGHGPAVA